MDVILDVLSRSTIRPEALIDGLARARATLGREPTLVEAEAWASSLKREAPHLFPLEPVTPGNDAARLGIPAAAWATMSPQEKLSRARSLQPSTQRAKPQRLELTSEQLSRLAQLPAGPRLTEYRRLQAEQGRH